jgi:hypothetical protein
MYKCSNKDIYIYNIVEVPWKVSNSEKVGKVATIGVESWMMSFWR